MDSENISYNNDGLSLTNIKKYILPRFSLENASVSMVKFKDSDKERAVFKVEKNNKSFCLKKIYYDEENLLFVYSAMEWLFRNNINVPKLLPSFNNNRFVLFNNMIFILTPWVEGDKCNFDNPKHVSLSCETLGKIHRVSKNFFPIEGSAKRVSLENFHLSINKHFNQLLENANYANNIKDKFSYLYLNNLDYNLDLAKLSLEISSTIDVNELSTSLCHGDYVNKNIIINENDDVFIIDFDKCKYDYSAYDISYFLRRFLKRPNTNWDTALTINILDNYMKENNLTSSDFKYILAYLSFPQKFWKLSRDYYKNIKKCNKKSFNTLLQKSLERTSNQLEYVKNMIIILEKYYNVKF